MTKPLEPDFSKNTARSPGGASSRGRWIVLALALVALGAVILFLATAEDTVDVTPARQQPPVQLVSIETLPVSAQTVEVSAYAEIRPRWAAELRAAVTGRVDKVFDSALAGERVNAGTTLITIENSRYVAELAEAELSLKQAQLALWKAENATILARKEFERNKAKPPNDLALRLPELEIARSSVTSSTARVAAAQQQLNDTRITAPFSGFVSERFISPGQSVNAGESLVKLVDDTVFELTVELGRKDWALLQQPLRGSTARIVDQNGKTTAEAMVRQAGGFLDESTRQYKVFLEINQSESQQILPGDFVRVLLPGVTVPAALSIPAPALTQEGHIWYLDTDNRLLRITPRVLFRRQDRIIIEAPGQAGTWRIATTPLKSFLPGQRARTDAKGD